MNTAVELLSVIEASHLSVTEELADRRADIVRLVDNCFRDSSDRSDKMAAELADLLVAEGVVLADQESVQEVIAEYLHVVTDEATALGDEEKSFLESFLK